MPPTDYLSSSAILTDLQIREVTGRFHLNLGFGWCFLKVNGYSDTSASLFNSLSSKADRCRWTVKFRSVTSRDAVPS